MKIQIYLIIGFCSLAMSCATSIPYLNEEFCAVDNMKFMNLEKHEGFSLIRMSSERAPIVRQETMMVTNCDAPQTAAEREHVQNLHEELEPKIRYNQTFYKSHAEYDKALTASSEIQAGRTKNHVQATFPKE